MTEVANGSIGNAAEEELYTHGGLQRPRPTERHNRKRWLIATLMLIGIPPFFPAKSQELYFYVANAPRPNDSVALRTRPSLNSGREILELPKGARLRVLELGPGGWWKVQVSPSGPEGWVRSDEGNELRVQCCILLGHD